MATHTAVQLADAVVDLRNAPQKMSVSDLRGLIVGYGRQIAAKWAAMAGRRAAVTAATTLVEVETA